MRYIQGLDLPFYLRGKEQGKKSFIDNEIVCNESSPEILMKRLRIDRLERLKKFDMFISHNSLNEEDIANKKLEETIISLFEFKGDKLKNKMLQEISKIRNEFPLWEYRGFTKTEVNK